MNIRWDFGRFRTLLKKECLQILRDPSPVMIGLGLPLLMLFLFGWGISMDIKNLPTAVVLDRSSPVMMRVATDFAANPWFRARIVPDRSIAEALLESRQVNVIVDFSADFDAERSQGAAPAAISITTYGVDSNSAQLFRTYAMGVLQGAMADMAAQAPAQPAVTLLTRTWFNEAAASVWYIVPGILVLVICIGGSLMGSGVVARECERGTFASLCASAASPLELLLAKAVPYLVIAWAGFAAAWLLAMTIFGVPFRGSAMLLVTESFCFALWAVMLGLFLSAKLKNQFLATEFAVILSFLPTVMLSGLLFDLRSVPAAIECLARLLPPAYAVEAFKICFLSGGSTGTVLFDIAVTLLWACLLFAAALKAMKKGDAS